MGEVKFYDFNKARKLGSDDEIVDYLRNTATTNINWDFYNNYDNTQIVNRLSEKADKLEIYDTGINQEALKADIQEKAKNLNAQKGGILQRTFINPVGDFFDTDDSKERKKQTRELTENLKYLDINKLSDEEADNVFMALDADKSDDRDRIIPLATKNNLEQFSKRGTLRYLQNQALQKDAILATERYQDLTKEQKQYVDDEWFGSVEGFARDYLPLFDSKAEEYKRMRQAKRDYEFVGEELPRLLETLKTQHNRLHHGLLSKEEKTKLAQDYLNNAATLAEKFGWDNVAYDENMNIALGKDGQYYYVNENTFDSLLPSLLDSKYEIAGSLAGMWAGAKAFGKGALKGAVKNGGKGGVWGTLGGAMIGGALGAAGGSNVDYIVNNYMLDREGSIKELIPKMVEAGALNLAGDLAIAGLSKIPLKSAVKGAVKYPLKATEFVVDRMPLLSSIKNAAKNNNFQAVDNMINKNIGQEAREEISKNLEEFGGKITTENINKYNEIKQTILEKYPDKAEGINKAFEIFETFSQESLKDKQNELLHLYRADRDGNLTSYLVEVANSSPELQKSLRAMLNQTTDKITQMVDELNLSPRTNAEIFNALEQNTKAEYAEVMERILPEIYDESYKTTIDSAPYAKRIQELLEDGLLSAEEKLPIKNLADEIFKPDQTFKRLVNIKKRLNDQYNKIADDGIRKYLETEVDGLLREAIDKGVNDILSQNKTAFVKARDLYDTMNLEYGRMKEVLGIVKDLKLRDKEVSFDKAFKNLYKYLEGQGEADLSNLQRLTRTMQEADKEVFEVAFLKKIFDESIKSKESQGIRVFDSTLFLKRLEELSKNGVAFESQGAKEFLNIVEGFHTLFRQDADIASKLTNAKGKNGVGNGIATTLSGRIQQALVNSIFSVFFRNIPESSIMAQVLTLGRGKDFIGGMALRYHTQKALQRSVSVDDFIEKFSHSIERAQWSSESKKKIDDFLNSLREIQTLSEAEIKAQNPLIPSNANKGAIQAFENLDLNTAKTAEVREALFEKLTPLIQKGMIKSVDNHEAYVSKGSIAKMISPAAVQKSIDNGFTRAEHLEAVADIENLFAKSHFAKTEPHKSGEKGVSIHRFNSDFKGNNALITIKESVENGKRIYSVELELIPRFNNATPLNNKISEGSLSSLQEARGGIKSESSIAKTDNAIISKNMPFASTKANFTKEEWENLSTQERIQAYKDQRARERAAIKAQEAELNAQKIAAQQAKAQQIQAQKDSNVGKAINETSLNLGDSIAYTPVKPTHINLENKGFKAQYVIINKNDLKPNFNTTGTQGRTQKQDNVIQDIQENLNPNKLFFSEGGFDGLPIILQDGSIAVGNHRAQALKNLSQESLAAYQKSAKEVFNVDLKDDELIVRMLDKDIPKQEILNLSFASNVGREQNIAEKALSTLGKYQENLDKLPPNIHAQSVEEMQNIVSKALDSTNNGLNTFDTNLALFASLSRSGNKNILESLKAIKGSAEEKQAVLRMFVENAGNFYNLTKQTQMPNIDLRPYLNQTLFFTASAKESRVQNFQELISTIESLLKTTDTQGSNALLEQNPSSYEDLVGKILGYSFARFKELENPSKAMFEFLNNIQSTLRQELEPTLFSSGRPLETADIYDFLSVSIKSGIPSDESSKLLDLLPQLKAKQEAFKAKNELLGNSEKLESVSKKNLHTENAVVKENLTTEAQKETESQGIPQAIKDIIDTGAQKGRDMQILGQENFTPEVVKYVQEQNKKVAIEKLSQEEAQHLGFKYPQDVRVTIDSSAINYTLKRHGAQSNLAQKSGQKAVSYDDIAKYRDYAKNADETLLSVDNGGSNVLVSYKQVNGHFVVVEQIKKKNNELGFKTLFKESGNYKDSASYKDTKAKAQTLSIGYEPSANSFALTKSSNSKEIISQTAHKTEAEIIDFVKNAEKEVESMERFHLNDPKYYYQVHKPDTLMAYEKEHFNNIPKALQEQLFEKFPKIQAQKFADNLREHDLAKEFKEFLDKNILNKPFAKSRDDLKYILSQLPQKDLVDLGFKSKQDFLAFESPAAKANFGKIQAKLKKGDYLGLPEKWSEYQTLKQRESIEQELNLNPTAEFGTNYAEFFRDGKGAIEKIMTEKQGQVSGAFYREDLKELSGNGDIDLVWGEVTDAEAHTGYGLAHIIDKRTAEFMQQGFSKQEAEAKALEFVESLPKMIEEMDLKTKPNEAIKLENDNFEIILKSNWKGEPTDNKWIVSAYIKKEKGESISSTPFTKKDNLSLNSNPNSTTNNTKLQSNAHIGSGILSGSVAGFETDEQGNLTLDPQKFLLGLAGGAVGSKAIAQGFKAIHKNPEFKEKLTQELADTLSKGWDSAVKQYPILESLQPRYIVKNEKGRIAQSKAILKEVEKEEIYRLRESTKQMLHNIAGKNITNAHDGRIAQVSKKNIGKMVSDKAIAKSVANGFSAMEHFNAVNDIESLYKNAIFKETQKDNKSTNPNTLIHRYESVYDNEASALITLKESLDPNTKGNKIYSLELEELKSLELKASAPDPQGESISSRNLGYAEPKTPDKNSESIIPQIQAKFKFDEKKAKDLAEWHKDSSPLTKDEQGLPKVFYHGTGDDYGFEIFKPNAIDGTPAIYFTTSKKVATSYAQMGYTKEGIYKTFLNIKNPLVVDFSGKSYDGLEYEKLLKKALRNGNDGVIIKNVFDDTGGYYDKQGNFKEIGKADTFIVFNPNQIKAVENKGLKGESGEYKYFNAESPNIYQSNAHIGSGLISGSVAGFETDEQGNLTLDPQKFLLGLAGGSVGSKAISKAVAKATELRVKKLSKAYPQMAKNNPQLFKEVFKKDLEFLAAKGTYNTLTSFFNKHKILDLNPKIFAGEKALLSGEFAPQKAKLQAAKDMLKAGKSDIQIWQSTGWFKDLDNHWKFEINPSGGEFLKDYDYMLKTNQHFGLSQILDDKALFEAYPELRGVFVSFEKDQSAGSYYAPKNNFIQITQKDEGAGIEALYHEIQHAVQNIEKFATGSRSGLEHHTLSYGEIEARNVERRFSSEFQKQHPHQSSELNPKIRAQNIKDFKKMELLERKIEKSKADIESYREKLEDYSYSPRYNAETYNKKFETLRKKEKNLEALEYQRDMIEWHNSGYWTGEYYKDNPTIKPIIEFYERTASQSARLERAFLDSSGKVDFNKLKIYPLPQADFNNPKQFKQKFENVNGKFGIIATPYKAVKVNIPYAYRHFYQNTNNTNRNYIKGAFFDVLQKPLFVAEQKTDKGNSVYFYKIYSYQNDKIGIFGIGIDEAGEINYKTLYADKKQNRLREMLKLNDENIKYIDREQLANANYNAH